MLEKGKKFAKKHKEELIGLGCVVGIFIIGTMIGKRMNKDFVKVGRSLQGKNWISWSPVDGSMTLENVKTLLDANANNSSRFAIFREGSNPDSYIGILLDDKSIIPELFKIPQK